MLYISCGLPNLLGAPSVKLSALSPPLSKLSLRVTFLNLSLSLTHTNTLDITQVHTSSHIEPNVTYGWKLKLKEETHTHYVREGVAIEGIN